MKMRYVLPVLVLTVLGSVAAKPKSSGPDPDKILKDLYRAHDSQKGPFFDRQNRSLLQQFFTRELTGLIMKDAKDSDGEVGALEFDPLYESQDPRITGLTVGKVNRGGILKHEDDEPEPGLAVVIVSFKDSGKPRSIGFTFAQTLKQTWKISDINYSDGSSLVGLLRGDGAGPNSGNVAQPDPE